MIKNILSLLTSVLLPLLTPELIKKGLDGFFESIEKYIVESKTELDNATILPLIKVLRSALNVTDSNPNT